MTRAITRRETIKRLRALPLDEPMCKDDRCPLETLFDLEASGLDYSASAWQDAFVLWADHHERSGEKYWPTLTPRQCLEALGVKP